ncbi:DUF1822 family protein [Pleurocapsales cyanobacterium LEGE 06147]|nr:DUF1822 family protein [Pleurocapsales cyanobacterium LEGE 06147]
MMSDLALFEPTQLILELTDKNINESWQQSQSAATSTSRWQTHLNQVCLKAFLPWLREEQNSRARVWLKGATLSNSWELVNGTAIALANKRLVLVPSEASDLSELRVPQEWVDIPDWTADYYLAVQVNLDDRYIRVWGYCTHQQLKAKGAYDSSDRTYSLAEEELITDLDVLWVAQELCSEEITQAAVAPLPEISSAQAENLLQRLGNPKVLLPRLAVPFSLWGALIQNEAWRDRLAKKRRGVREQVPVLQLLQAGISNLVAELGWQPVEFQPSFVGARSATTESTSAIALAKQLIIAGQSYQLRILPLGNEEERVWRFELRSLVLGGTIPAGFKLRLVTEDLQPFEGNEDVADTAVEQLALEVALEPGEGLIWEIEPTPNNYGREILRF